MKYVWQSPLLQEYLRTWTSGKTVHCASFFFSKKGTSKLQRSLEGLYRTLLVHLIQSEERLARIAFPHRRPSDDEHHPKASVLQNALLRILQDKSLPRKYCFFIDGLDELEVTDAGSLYGLVANILHLANLPGVKVVVASRPWNAFVSAFDRYPTLHIHELTAGDIEAYVAAEFIRAKFLRVSLKGDGAKKLASLAQKVAEKSQGVFAWVILAVQNLLMGCERGDDFPELDARLRALPDDLGTLKEKPLSNTMPDPSGSTSDHHEAWHNKASQSRHDLPGFASDTGPHSQTQSSLRYEVYDSLVESFPLVATIIYSRRHSAPSSSAQTEYLTDTLPTLMSRDTVPTSVTNSADCRRDQWESGSVGSIPDTFLLSPGIKEQMQRKFAYDIIVALNSDHDTQHVMNWSATHLLSQLLKEFTILCRIHAGNESEINATRFVRHSRK